MLFRSLQEEGMGRKPRNLLYVLALRLPPTITFVLADRASIYAVEPIRVGIIGLDTSHCIEFTRIFNDASDPEHVPGVRVVAAFKGGSPDIDASRNRVDGFTAELRD